MRYVKLSDGTIVTNCTDSTTCNEIFALRDTEALAGDVLSLFADANTGAIKIYDSETDELLSSGFDLALIDEGTIIPNMDGGFICEIKIRKKTELEVIKEEIAELQEAILG